MMPGLRSIALLTFPLCEFVGIRSPQGHVEWGADNMRKRKEMQMAEQVCSTERTQSFYTPPVSYAFEWLAVVMNMGQRTHDLTHITSLYTTQAKQAAEFGSPGRPAKLTAERPRNHLSPTGIYRCP